jgi:tRNA-binding protein
LIIEEEMLDDPLDCAPAPATVEAFNEFDMRVGRIVRSVAFPEARKPSYKLVIDFGPLGIKNSSAHLTEYYTPHELIGRLVVAVINFPPRVIAGFPSEVLVLGVPGEGVARLGPVALLVPDREVPLGARVF